MKVTKDDFKICGRHVEKDGTLYLSFSAAYIEFKTDASCVLARIRSEYPKDPVIEGFIGVFVDGVYTKRIALDRLEAEYEIYKGDKKEKIIRIVRLSETNFGKVGIIDVEADGYIAPTPEKPFKMEVIGDSITCGYGVEAAEATVPFSTSTENPILAYAYLAAEDLDADLHLVSWSGNGLISQWIPPERDEAETTSPLMSEVYKKTDIAGYKYYGLEVAEDFDFSSFIPQVVVINLGTNDFSYTRGKADRVAAYKAAYKDLLAVIRAHRPDAHIFCTLGVMGQDLDATVAELVAESGDDKMHFIEYAEHMGETDRGSDWHPCKACQRKMADLLVKNIREVFS